MRVETLPYSNEPERRKKDLEEIFWLTAPKAPTEPEVRAKFLLKYHQVYIQNWPEDVYYAIDDETNEIMGYLLGCRDSKLAMDVLDPLLTSYRAFEGYYKTYPAHLHMDVHPKFQNRGVGTFLFGQFRSDLELSRIRGLHIINSPQERSVSFYRKSGLTFEVLKKVNDIELLFMGTQF
jgi:GNAT superfamily N-acetyltransferase